MVLATTTQDGNKNRNDFVVVDDDDDEDSNIDLINNKGSSGSNSTNTEQTNIIAVTTEATNTDTDTTTITTVSELFLPTKTTMSFAERMKEMFDSFRISDMNCKRTLSSHSNGSNKKVLQGRQKRIPIQTTSDNDAAACIVAVLPSPHYSFGDRGNDDLNFYQVGGQYVDHSHDRDRKRFKGKVVALCNVPLQAGVT